MSKEDLNGKKALIRSKVNLFGLKSLMNRENNGIPLTSQGDRQQNHLGRVKMIDGDGDRPMSQQGKIDTLKNAFSPNTQFQRLGLNSR